MHSELYSHLQREREDEVIWENVFGCPHTVELLLVCTVCTKSKYYFVKLSYPFLQMNLMWHLLPHYITRIRLEDKKYFLSLAFVYFCELFVPLSQMQMFQFVCCLSWLFSLSIRGVTVQIDYGLVLITGSVCAMFRENWLFACCQIKIVIKQIIKLQATVLINTIEQRY